MIVFCNGMPRSASTWSYNVIKELLRRCFPGEAIQGGRTEAPVQFLRSLAPEARHAVMKCHSLTPLGRTLARTGAAKVVYTTRDLSDAVASALAKFEIPYEQIIEVYKLSLQLHAFHRKTGNAVIVHYEDVLHRPSHAIRQIADYLTKGRATNVMIDEIASQTSFERMRQKVEEINAMDESCLDDSFDLETLLHRNHMGDGRSGRGRELLTAAQLAHLDTLARQHTL
jgi:hypothetical protein